MTRSAWHKQRHTEAREKWIFLVEEYNRSGETVEEFCAHHDVASTTFYKWRLRLKAEAGGEELAGIGKPDNVVTKACRRPYVQKKSDSSPERNRYPDVYASATYNNLTAPVIEQTPEATKNGTITLISKRAVIRLSADATPQEVAAAWMLMSGRTAVFKQSAEHSQNDEAATLKVG